MGERPKTIIIGAGASGLSLARRLRQLGEGDAIILEAGPVAGGKCATMEFEGRTYELGAVLATGGYRRLRSIMREHGVEWRVHLSCRFADAATGRITGHHYLPPCLTLGDVLRLPERAVRLAVDTLHAHTSRYPRLDGVPEDWYQPFESWARAHDMMPLLEVLRPWSTGCGYGFMEEVPAAYMLNYLTVLGPSFSLPDTGLGGLWRRVAATYDVRYETRVERVRRDARGVVVQTDRGTFEAERLVIACPLEDAKQFLDASDEERSLFGQVQCLDYQVVALDTEGMPPERVVYLPENFASAQRGRPLVYYRRYPDRGVITVYSYRDKDGLEGAEREALSLVRRMGGRTRKLLARRSYRYFPHVTSDSLRAGFYPRMEALQGKNSTYYAGEVMSFSCVEPVVAYAELLAERIVMGTQHLEQHVEPRQLPWPGVANDVIRRLAKRSA